MSRNPLPHAPRSRLAPFRGHEQWHERHRRRRETALEHEDKLRRWAEARGGELRVLNGGLHWQLVFADTRAEWWPDSGRLVRDKRWSRPRKAHDVHQVINIVSGWLSSRGAR